MKSTALKKELQSLRPDEEEDLKEEEKKEEDKEGEREEGDAIEVHDIELKKKGNEVSQQQELEDLTPEKLLKEKGWEKLVHEKIKQLID